jgi:hypothetical protein
MSTFLQTINPTPFGYFDSDTTFQSDADKMAIFVKRMLGDDILSVELTKKQIWSCFENATLEYSKIVNEYAIKSQIGNLLGQPTSSNASSTYPRQTLELLLRQAEPYAMESDVGGSYESKLGYIELISGQQDYNIYSDLREPSGSFMFQNLSSSLQTKIKLTEIYHFSPAVAQQHLLNASNITNFLATEFKYESYVNSSVFYVLPMFEDVLRRGMLESAYRLRRSNYSYAVYGTTLRIFPIPLMTSPAFINKLWIRYRLKPDPLNPDYKDSSGNLIQDSTIKNSISNPSNVPFDNIPYKNINSPGKQWVREYTLALATELLGRIRSKMKSIPIPGADLQLNGDDLIAQAREDKEKLISQMKEMMDDLTYDKILEKEANKAESINKQLKYIPMPLGKCIIVG